MLTVHDMDQYDDILHGRITILQNFNIISWYDIYIYIFYNSIWLVNGCEIGDADYGCRSHIESDVRRSQCSSFLQHKSLIFRISVLVLVDLQVQNLGSWMFWTRIKFTHDSWKSKWGSQSTWPCFAHVFLTFLLYRFARISLWAVLWVLLETESLTFFASFASQESMKSRASLKGLSSRNKRENPLLCLPQSWLHLHGASVFQLICCCTAKVLLLFDRRLGNTAMVFGMQLEQKGAVGHPKFVFLAVQERPSYAVATAMDIPGTDFRGGIASAMSYCSVSSIIMNHHQSTHSLFIYSENNTIIIISYDYWYHSLKLLSIISEVIIHHHSLSIISPCPLNFLVSDHVAASESCGFPLINCNTCESWTGACQTKPYK